MTGTAHAPAGRAGILLFARMDSRRLPGKALRSLAGKPILSVVLARLRRSTLGHAVVLATSDRPVDDLLAAWAAREGVGCFRGPAEDVAARALGAADANGFDWFVRISGDSPFIDPAVVDAVAGAFRRHRPDLATNVFPRHLPPGQSAEAISRPALARALDETRAPEDREHVTRHFYTHPERYRIVNVRAFKRAAQADGAHHLAVDTRWDLHRARRIARHVGDPVAAPLSRLLRAAADTGRGATA